MEQEAMLFWGIGLLAAALLLVVIEVFVPSGGLIAIVATGVALAGIVCLFRYSTTWGIIGILAMMLMGPAAMGFALKVWPHTPIGRKMLGERPPEVVEAERLAELRARERLLALVGTEGVALTDLRPIGTIRIDGERFEAASETGLVKSGARVRVTRVDANQIRVREIA